MIVAYSLLEKEDRDLICRAEEVMQHGYDPYSHFFVGCALKTIEGHIFTGANINTCAYGGVCAERAAISAAISNGDYKFEKLAIIAKSKFFDVTELSGPCGICRQMIWEFSELISSDIKILSSDTKKKRVLRTSISKLHPFGFGPRACDGDIGSYLKD